MDLGVYVLLGVAESVLMLYVGSGLLGYRLSTGKLWPMAAALAGVAIFVRQVYYFLGIELGTHTIIIVASAVLILKYAGSLPWGAAAASVLMSTILLTVGGVLIGLTGVGTLAAGRFSGAVPEAEPWLVINFVEKSALILAGLLVWRRGLILVRLPWR